MLRPSTLVVACTLATAGTARADGYYYSESVGFASARGEDASAMSASLRTRAGLGYRYGALSIEPWVSADLTFSRDGATLEVFGGSPAMGHADLEGGGLDLKLSEPLGRGFSLYTRAGPRYAAATGALADYSGWGFGAGTGVALVGHVRALGFLWAPLFFTSKGPHVLAALFLDEGVDVYSLHASGMTSIATPVLATSFGFAVGTDF
jgi:hypothetical protein